MELYSSPTMSALTFCLSLLSLIVAFSLTLLMTSVFTDILQ